VPINYEQENPDLYKEARRLFFEEGIRSPAQIRAKLAGKFGSNKVPSWRTVWRWCKEEWDPMVSVTSSINKVTAVQTSSDTPETKSIMRDIEPVHKKSVQLIEPIELIQLIEKGIPKEKAVRLLANWDTSFWRYRRQPDWVDKYRTMVFQRAANIFAEFPDIPFEKGIYLADLESKAELFDIPLAKEIADLCKRYRIWEGPENLRAFWEVFYAIHPKLDKQREKRVSKGIRQRLFGKADRYEDILAAQKGKVDPWMQIYIRQEEDKLGDQLKERRK
jgi:hypothetical protein